MATTMQRLNMRIARQQASDQELARLLGITLEQLDRDTTAPDPSAPRAPDPSRLDFYMDVHSLERYVCDALDADRARFYTAAGNRPLLHVTDNGHDMTLAVDVVYLDSTRRAAYRLSGPDRQFVRQIWQDRIRMDDYRDEREQARAAQLGML